MIRMRIDGVGVVTVLMGVSTVTVAVCIRL
jgi:hypothetical protein